MRYSELVRVLAFSVISTLAMISQAQTSTQVLFTDVRVFDGVNDGLKSVDVLVEGNLIKSIGERPGHE